jgi:hypothetical protein
MHSTQTGRKENIFLSSMTNGRLTNFDIAILLRLGMVVSNACFCDGPLYSDADLVKRFK